MFYTNTSQNVIRQRCEETLDLANENADITFFAADNRYSYNHTIWSNDAAMQPDQINKVVALGDSLSDTAGEPAPIDPETLAPKSVTSIHNQVQAAANGVPPVTEQYIPHLGSKRRAAVSVPGAMELP